MRDALSLLDQGVAFGGGKVTANGISSMLGSIDRAHVLRMLEALVQQDGAALLGEVDRLDERAPDYGAVLDELLGALQSIAVLQLVKGRGSEELAALAPLAERMSEEDVQLYYQIALQGRRDLAVCRDARMGFEMTLLRMLAFRPGERRAAMSVRYRSLPRRSAEAQEPAAPKLARDAARGVAATKAARARRPSSATGRCRIGTSCCHTLDLRGPARQLADHCDLAVIRGQHVAARSANRTRRI